MLRDEARVTEGRTPNDATLRELTLARELLDAADLLLESPKLSSAALALLRDTAELLSSRQADDGALSSGLSPSELSALSPEARQTRSHTLRKALGAKLAELEAIAYRHERLVRLRRARIAVAALASLSIALALLLVLGVIGPAKNLALHKPVAPSSVFAGENYPPAGLVDGNADDVGFHTELEEDPSVTISLLALHTIRRVVVVNRSSHRERALPLVIETSVDGKTYREFARRERVFEKWTAKGAPVQAGFVRLRVLNRTYLHLNEVSVY